MSVKTIRPTETVWIVAHGNGGVAYAEVRQGQSFSTAQPVLEQFWNMEDADARMRQFDPVWKLGPFDVNTASEADLLRLPGLNTSTAARLVEMRPHAALEDLSALPGITPAMLASWGAAVFVDETIYEELRIAAATTPEEVGAPASPPAASLDEILGVLAELRWQVETGGLTLEDGRMVRTTRESQAQLTAAANAYEAGYLTEPVEWKMEGGWVTLTPSDIKLLAAAVARHVQACFGAERKVSDAILAMQNPRMADVAQLFNDEYAARLGG